MGSYVESPGKIKIRNAHGAGIQIEMVRAVRGFKARIAQAETPDG